MILHVKVRFYTGETTLTVHSFPELFRQRIVRLLLFLQLGVLVHHRPEVALVLPNGHLLLPDLGCESASCFWLS
jgi:hypothetical protein